MVGVEVTIAAGVVAVVCVVGLLVKMGGLRFGPLVVEEDELVVVDDVGLALGRLVVVAEGLLDFRAVVDLTSKVVSSSLCWNTISWCLGCSFILCGVEPPSSSHRQIFVEIKATTNGSRNRSLILKLYILSGANMNQD
jgi:hypothetical protein